MIGRSTTDSEVKSPVEDHFGWVPGSGVVRDRFWRDADGAGWSGVHNHSGTRHGNGDVSDMVYCKGAASKRLQYDNLHVFITTHDGKRIQLSVNPQSTIYELRKKIYGTQNIPLNQ